MPEILVRRETADEHLARGAVFGDDLDLIHSPVDGAIVTVAMRHGVHVCWYCFRGFDQGVPRLRRQEVLLGFSRVLLHAGCESKQPRAFVGADLDQVREIRVRKGMKNVAEATKRIASAALAGAKRIIVG